MAHKIDFQTLIKEKDIPIVKLIAKAAKPHSQRARALLELNKGASLEDAANNRLEVPDGALVADEELAVRIPGSAMWNNGGDTAFLFNQLGGLVDSFSYAGGGSVACR